MAADHRRIAEGAIAAAIDAAPCAPALLEARRRHRRRFEHRGIGQRDLVGDGFALGCDRGPSVVAVSSARRMLRDTPARCLPKFQQPASFSLVHRRSLGLFSVLSCGARRLEVRLSPIIDVASRYLELAMQNSSGPSGRTAPNYGPSFGT